MLKIYFCWLGDVGILVLAHTIFLTLLYFVVHYMAPSAQLLTFEKLM